MQEIDVNTDALQQILLGTKTIEVRLGQPQYLKIRVGDLVSLRERDGHLAATSTIKIKQLLFFESFQDAFNAVDYSLAFPEAGSKTEAIKTCHQQYTDAEEYEYGVIIMVFELLPTPH